ncbi:amino acid ABC transporter permease [Nordella sp. HKS 07]|uniref:amino acid ABC transporter permease n=1 Tax=Nordella sp. HKS 07 TaxID=2712222 RepID=UPI0013E1E489|nr:amino acid ABC transporter permease [Nordella sp. HKS 07]QIG47758.1 amino acid ABC transporter permease [Nordella sp. HKS 07]
MIRDFSADEILLLLLAARWTILLSLIAFVGGSIAGFLIALARTSRAKTLRWAATGYIELFQDTPLLMQLFVIFFGANIIGLQINAWTAASLGLTLYASAFLGEIWRGCIEAVPKGQWEAAKALGLRQWQATLLIVAPQAVKLAIPPTIGFLVQLIKNTSLASIIGFTELTRTAQLVNNATYQPLTVFLIVSLIYFSLCWPLSRTSRWLEKRLAVQG